MAKAKEAAVVDHPKKESMGFIRTLGTLMSRLGIGQLVSRFSDARDFYGVFGWVISPTQKQFWAKYLRQEIVGRIIDMPPDATWADGATLTMSDLDNPDPEPITEWEEIVEKVEMWSKVQRADRLSRLGPFSILLFGFNDTGQLSRAANPEQIDKLLYVRPMGIKQVTGIKMVEDPLNERFGAPEMYTLDIDNPASRTIQDGNVSVETVTSINVHWTRIIHVVENPLDDDIFGIPIIEQLFNTLDDMLKVTGGTAETYWLTSNRGMQVDIDKEMELEPEDTKALADEIDEYMHELRRVIHTRGVKLNTLGGQTPSPSQTFDMQISLISAATGIPQRILLGSEAGQLSSIQDRSNWAERVDERRRLFAEPRVLRRIIELLQLVGLIPEGHVNIIWPDAFKLSPLEKAQNMAQQARAIGNMSRQTGNQTPMQLTSRAEARTILGLIGDLSEEDLYDPNEAPQLDVPEPVVAPTPVPGKEDDKKKGDASSQ